MDRRSFIRLGAAGTVAAVTGIHNLGCSLPSAFVGEESYGPLGAADANGVKLPSGFTSRVVAKADSKVAGTSYTWHRAPDGGACFPAANDGWTYVSNSELDNGSGGVGSITFNSTGAIVGARRILSGTNRNCAGGATPWGTWLSCEENGSSGKVYECWPENQQTAVLRSAMGSFNHEAAACDPVGQYVYLTEDASRGKLRRFRPTTWGDLSTGVLQAAVVSNGTITWTTTISNGTAFNNGEGAWYANGKLWFTTKGDNKVWEVDLRASPMTIRVIYDEKTSPNAVLAGVDNVVGAASGDLFVAEDGGNMELVLLEPTGAVSVFLQVTGQRDSELAGPAFNPAGNRLYLSSQRGGNGNGITYEITGPFRTSP